MDSERSQSWFRRSSDNVKGKIHKIRGITKNAFTYLTTDHFKKEAIRIIEYKKLHALYPAGTPKAKDNNADITRNYNRAIEIANSWRTAFERLVNFKQPVDLANYAISEAYAEDRKARGMWSDNISNEHTPSLVSSADWKRVWNQHRGGKSRKSSKSSKTRKNRKTRSRK